MGCVRHYLATCNNSHCYFIIYTFDTIKLLLNMKKFWNKIEIAIKYNTSESKISRILNKK